ncbi:MAG: hypothetical protein ACK4PR_04225 [Gammaproteobacteria bacterium]
MSIDDLLVWNNQTNDSFYENEYTEILLRERAQLVGMDTGEDIQVIYDLIGNQETLLEVGGGYGRVIDCLIAKKFSGKIFVIEKSRILYESLLKKYNKHAIICHDDIITYQPNNKFDVILSLWSGISDFAIEEQGLFIKQLAGLLNSNGKIFLDIFARDQIPMASNQVKNNYYKIVLNGIPANGYIPSEIEIRLYCQESKLYVANIVEYFTNNNIRRLIYILKKRT